MPIAFIIALRLSGEFNNNRIKEFWVYHQLKTMMTWRILRKRLPEVEVKDEVEADDGIDLPHTNAVPALPHIHTVLSSNPATINAAATNPTLTSLSLLLCWILLQSLQSQP